MGYTETRYLYLQRKHQLAKRLAKLMPVVASFAAAGCYNEIVPLNIRIEDAQDLLEDKYETYTD